MGFVLSRTELEALIPGRGPGDPGRSGRGASSQKHVIHEWPAEVLHRLAQRLEEAAAALGRALNERMARTGDSGAVSEVSIEFLGLAAGARLPQVASGNGTWVFQGERPRESGRIVMEPSLAVALVQGLLGGGVDEALTGDDEDSRPLSGLEHSLLTRVVELVATTLLGEYRGQVPGSDRPRSLSVRAESAHTECGASTDGVIAGLSWHLANGQGLVHVELSAGSVEALADLSRTEASSELSADETDDSLAQRGVNLSVRMPVPLEVSTARRGWCVGDIVMTGQPVPGTDDRPQGDLWVDGVLRFQGHLVAGERGREVVLGPPQQVQ